MPATLERFISSGASITTDVFLPKCAGRHPATLVLHGTFGLLPPFGADIVSFAEALADRGIVAAIPHYFERTHTPEGPDAALAIEANLAEWTTTCGEALAFMRDHVSVNAGRLGVLGFSLGGHLALSLGMSTPQAARLKCVVDFFAPIQRPRLVGSRAALPPVLIHHGTNDLTVPFQDSVTLEMELKAAGKVEGVGYQFFKYPGEGHGFTGPALVAARKRTVDYLEAIL